MTHINLLPWRAEQRMQREREFRSMLGLSALIGLLLSVLIWWYYDQQVSGQITRNAYLSEAIAQVSAQNKEIDALAKKRDRLLARKQVIETLQANRSQMVHVFDSLVRTIPDGVVLTGVKQEGERLTLEGQAQSNARVSTYMRTLEGSGWMIRPELSIIEAQVGNVAVGLDTKALPYGFTLKVTLANPNPATETVPQNLASSGPAVQRQVGGSR